MEWNWDVLPSQPCPETMFFPPDHGGLGCRPFMELKIVTYRHSKSSKGSLFCLRQAGQCTGSHRSRHLAAEVPCDPLRPHRPVPCLVPCLAPAPGAARDFHTGSQGTCTNCAYAGTPALLHIHLTLQLPFPSTPSSSQLDPQLSYNRVPQDTIKSITSTSPASVCGERERDRQTDQLGSSGLGFKTDGRTNLKFRESWITAWYSGTWYLVFLSLL